MSNIFTEIPSKFCYNCGSLNGNNHFSVNPSSFISKQPDEYCLKKLIIVLPYINKCEYWNKDTSGISESMKKRGEKYK